MKILDVLTSPWAIQPSKLIEIQAIYATHLRGEKIDIAAVEKRIGASLNNEPQGYDINQGVAVISMHGIIAKRMNLFAQISGGVSTELVGRDLRAALEDPSVHSILLDIDSPGGTVDGTQALAQLVLAAREVKPVYTLADGMLASAAYWIGSAASGVYITDGTTQVGSIGVVASHVDVSKHEDMMGYKTTEIYAGKYKRAASQYEPLTDEGRRTIQDEVDYIYSVFVADVAAQRGVSENRVLADMADGRVFVGAQAIAAGLVDGVSTLDTLIAQLNSNRGQGGSAHAIPTNQTRGKTMNMKATSKPVAEDGDTCTLDDGSEGVMRDGVCVPADDGTEVPEAVRAALRAAGARAERERIQAVESQLISGHEALINALKFDGKTSGPEAAVAVLNAERSKRAQVLTRLQGDAPATAAFAAAPATTTAQVTTDEDNQPLEDRCKATWDKDANLRAEFGGKLERYVAYERANKSGRLKVLGKGA